MTFLELYSLPQTQQAIWIDRIGKGDWRAAPYLAGQLRAGTFRQHCGQDARVLLLTDEDQLISFCTLVRQDEIPDPELFPWIGFVYTFPDFRGHRCSEKLIGYACAIAREEGYVRVYLSSDEEGLYEKYGFSRLAPMAARDGRITQVFSKSL